MMEFTLGEEMDLSLMVDQTDIELPPLLRIYYQTPAFDEELSEAINEARAIFDEDDSAQKFITYWRSQEAEDGGEYHVIIAGALLMRAGAKIDESEMQHLRELVPRINCNSGFTPPELDHGFRTPGRAQFLAALDHYQPGVPRNFHEPSCYHCGKIAVDIGKKLLKCGHCKAAWYCDRDCQSAHWQEHKPSCRDRRRRWLANV